MKKFLLVLLLIPILCFSTETTKTLSYVKGAHNWKTLGVDSLVWNAAANDTLSISTILKVGEYDIFSLKLWGDVDSTVWEYITFADTPDLALWDFWYLVDTIKTDTVYMGDVFTCSPFDGKAKIRAKSLSTKNRTLHIRWSMAK